MTADHLLLQSETVIDALDRIRERLLTGAASTDPSLVEIADRLLGGKKLRPSEALVLVSLIEDLRSLRAEWHRYDTERMFNVRQDFLNKLPSTSP